MSRGFVYILRDNKGKLYIGSTSDIMRRMKQHASGHTQTTRNMKNAELVLQQEYDSLATARKVEKAIKTMKRKDYIAKMIEDGYIKLAK